MATRQWGAIRTLPSGRVQASYTGPDRLRYTAPETFTDDPKRPGLKPTTARAKAEAWLRGVRADIERGTWVSPTVLAERAAEEAKKSEAERFGSYAETWVAQRKSKGMPLRPKTRAEYERILRVGLSKFAEDRLNAITPAMVRTWHDERTKHGPTQAGAEARLLGAIMNTALVDGIIDRNPVDRELTKSRTGMKHRPPTVDELSVLLEHVGEFFRLGVLLGAYGGLRLSEWRALRRQDLTITDRRVFVTVERQALYVPRVGWVVGSPKSTEGTRIVPLPIGLTETVEQHLETYVGRFPGSLIFPPDSDSEFFHDRMFNRQWDRARVAAGVRYRVDDQKKGTPPKWEAVVREHDLRAFAATMHAQSGATLRETMALLGHSTTVAAMAYQATTGREVELADRMPLPKVSTNMTKSLRGT